MKGATLDGGAFTWARVQPLYDADPNRDLGI